MHRPFVLLLAAALVLTAAPADAQRRRPGKEGAGEGETETPFPSADLFVGLELRGIGPAVASGRVVDFAVHPQRSEVFYVATASGGLWKTKNDGTTWTPIFDGQGSYSIGVVTLDPNDPLVVWVGTGENNSQRSVGYGDGVYKSVDGGTTWQNVGLPESEHIGGIVVDPRDSRRVLVAAQGPLWRAGGDRGLYETNDGGETWERILEIDEHTGVSEIHFDPRDPDVLYAVAYQRRRRQWTLINGGPGSGIHKSTDGGKSWRLLENGLPEVELGRIGLALSPADPDVIYAIVEAQGDEGGVFRSVDRGSNWEKRSDYVSSSPQYYQELVADPKDIDRVYSLDTYLQVSDDGGTTFRRAGQEFRHVDEHALWIDPDNTDHLLSGNDGGVYSSYDRGQTWRFRANLPITQFYKIAADDDRPFYNVYGGTQDNNTLGGPSRTTNAHGISNDDWFVTQPGDGFQPRAEPGRPDVVYSQAQYGNLTRFDRRSGERIAIRPQVGPGEDPLRWNWDSPLITSHHSPTRIYYAAQRVFRSDDRGESWQPVSGDLTRQIDRNRLEVMGRVWSVDAVAKNDSTSFYGTVVALAESPLVEGLLYAGTDDGLVQVLEPEAEEWRRIDRFPGVPEGSYVARLEASLHDGNTVYAAFNNHKSGDFEPYLMRSTDRGRSWGSISGDLPERGSTWALIEDHVDPELLFAGTEFGLFFTLDGGRRWFQLKGGMPVISVRDLAIQRRESDLVVGTFGRGFFILDDYSPLRQLDEEALRSEAILFPVKDAWMYHEAVPLGELGKGFQGHAFYTAPNPPFGAVFTYFLGEEIETLEAARKSREKEAVEEGEPTPYPSWEELRAEDREREPHVELLVEDEEGNVVRRLVGPTDKGFHRLAWDLRYPAATPTSLEQPEDESIFSRAPRGPMVAPGTYRVRLAKIVRGERAPLGDPQTFEARPLGMQTFPAEDRAALLAFQRRTAELQRAVLGAARTIEETRLRLDHLRQALQDTPQALPGLRERLEQAVERLADLDRQLRGDGTVASRNEPTPPSITERVQSVVGGHWNTSAGATATHSRAYELAADAFEPVLEDLRQLVEVELAAIEAELEASGAPWTPGRVPRWER